MILLGGRAKRRHLAPGRLSSNGCQPHGETGPPICVRLCSSPSRVSRSRVRGGMRVSCRLLYVPRLRAESRTYSQCTLRTGNVLILVIESYFCRLDLVAQGTLRLPGSLSRSMQMRWPAHAFCQGSSDADPTTCLSCAASPEQKWHFRAGPRTCPSLPSSSSSHSVHPPDLRQSRRLRRLLVSYKHKSDSEMPHVLITAFSKAFVASDDHLALCCRQDR